MKQRSLVKYRRYVSYDSYRWIQTKEEKNSAELSFQLSKKMFNVGDEQCYQTADCYTKQDQNDRKICLQF